MHNPELLILDEPTSSMDSASEKQVLENLINWAKNKTLIAITHRNTILKIVSRAIIIDKGVIIADDTPEKLIGPRPT